MSFRNFYERAQDPGAPLEKRYRALRHAGERYASLTQTSFQSVFRELGERHPLLEHFRTSPSAISAAAESLRSARDHFVARLREVEDGRRRAKFRSRGSGRPPFPSEVRGAIVLGQPLHESPAAELDVGPGAAEPPPNAQASFPLGACVRVKVNERNRTAHLGVVRFRAWHFKRGRWTYFLLAGTRKVSKMYFADDLELLDGSDGSPT